MSTAQDDVRARQGGDYTPPVLAEPTDPDAPFDPAEDDDERPAPPVPLGK